MDEPMINNEEWCEESLEQTEYITVKDEVMDLDTEDEMYEGYYVLEVDEEETNERDVKEEEAEEVDVKQEDSEEGDCKQQTELKELSDDMSDKEHGEPTDLESDGNILKQESNTEDHTSYDKKMKETTKIDLFQQPFVLKYLQNRVQAKNQKEPDNLLLKNEFESFVDPKSVCRLCMKTEQNIFMRLFYTNNEQTPIAKKLAFLLGNEKVDEDLLPQQICLECSELVNSCYSSVKRFSESYQILSEVVAEIKKKTHVFHKPGFNTSVQLKIYEKCYEFCQNMDSTNTDKKKSKKQKLDHGSNIKCYLCKQSFSYEMLKDHMAEEHDCHIEYKCTSCDFTFSSLSLLNEHDCPNDNQSEYDYDKATSDDDVMSVSHTTFEMDKHIPKEKSKNKRIILDENCNKILALGTKDTRSCKYCPRVFKSTFSEDVLRAHIASHINDLENAADLEPANIILSEHLIATPCYVCTYCEMPKKTPTELRNHLSFSCSSFAHKVNIKCRDRRRKKNSKTNSKIVCCKMCGDSVQFSRKKDYINHVKDNHFEMLYRCASCPKSFLSRSELSYHNKLKHLHPQQISDEKENSKVKKVKEQREPKSSFLCEFCSRECKTKSGYQQHVLKSHFSTEGISKRKLTKRAKKPYIGVGLECPICNITLKFKDGQSGLDFHIMKHSSPTGKIECCNREYDSYTKYKMHINSHSRKWPCRSCGSEFGSSVLLQDHVASTHSKCKDCSYLAKNLEEYIKHRDKCPSSNGSHTSVVCTTCNIMFSCKKDLMYHQRQAHWDEYNASIQPKSDLSEPILCCGRKFTKKVNLKAHVAKHQDTVCKTCGDVLKSKLALQNHNATHHRQGVECSYCNKTFCNSDSLRYHMLKHTQGRVFKCPCGLSFYTEADVHKHQRSRKTPCLGSMIQQAPGMSEIPIIQVQNDPDNGVEETEEVEWTEI